ncbi:MAG: hypothetical protein KDC44_14195, partial [Phaeodactylibacter sp.]|nr:hypothetical protein [Phaeodactylibacter sp.]
MSRYCNKTPKATPPIGSNADYVQAIGDQQSSTALNPPPLQLQRESARAQNPVIQRYTEVKKSAQSTTEWDVGSDARVSDTGETVTTEMMHEAYATADQIKWSNQILKAQDSGIEISAGGKTVTGTAPNGSGRKTLKEVKPNIRSSSKPASSQDFWTDCGRSSREVMGPHNADKSPRGNYMNNSGKLAETAASSNPATFRDEIWTKSGLDADPDKARDAYLALSDKDRDAFDKKHKINKYADPGIGDAFVSRRDDKSTTSGFNFHWGGVIMHPGHDKVTFENFAKTGTTYASKDEKWYFETYGPPSKKGQTFHEQNEGSVGAKNKNNTTM